MAVHEAAVEARLDRLPECDLAGDDRVVRKAQCQHTPVAVGLGGDTGERPERLAVEQAAVLPDEMEAAVLPQPCRLQFDRFGMSEPETLDGRVGDAGDGGSDGASLQPCHEDDPVLVGDQRVAWLAADAGELHRDAGLPLAVLVLPARHRGESHDAEVERLQHVGVTDAAPDDDAGPPVLERVPGDHVALPRLFDRLWLRGQRLSEEGRRL